jgi:diguanylate cyclase (GGDEF)-like protein
MLVHREIKPYAGQVNTLLRGAGSSRAVSVGDWFALEQEYGEDVYSEALYQLTRLELPPDQARSCWNGILTHQDRLEKLLGRNVSLLTALCDYFTNVQPLVKEPILVEVRLLLQKEESAYKDELTGLFNRRYFNQEIPREMERFRRFGHPFSLLMLDLDHFKRFNDSHGHLAGDQALRDLAAILNQSARLYDRAVRYGGEEFAVILPQTCREEALIAAERIREAVERHVVRLDGRVLSGFTVSIGAAVYPVDAVDMESLVQRADQALYEAKRERNRVAAFRDSKRRHPRFNLDAILNCQLRGEQHSWAAKARNISLGGLLCEGDINGPLDSPLDVILMDQKRNTRLLLRARVSRVDKSEDDGFQVGLTFEVNTTEERRALMALIEGSTKAMH